MVSKNVWWYPLIFGVLGTLLGLILRYAFTGAISGFPFKNVLHSHSHVLLLGFIFNSLLILVWEYFASGFDKTSYKYYLALQICIAVMLVAFILQGYAFYSILFSTLHLWLSYILLIRLWKQLKENSSIEIFIKIGIVFHFLSSIGPYVLGPLMVMKMQESPLYQQAIFFYLHFQYFGVFFVWMLAILMKKTSVVINKKQIALITLGLILLFAHSLDYSYDHWLINIVGGIGAILLLVVLLSINKTFHKSRLEYKNVYFIILLTGFINIIGSIPIIADRVVENRLLLIGWLHFLFLGLYAPFIWILLKKKISLSIWIIYAVMLSITEIILVFPTVVVKWIPIPLMWLLFFAYLGVFLCFCTIHLQFLLETRTRTISN